MLGAGGRGGRGGGGWGAFQVVVGGGFFKWKEKGTREKWKG